jgi:mannitol/fructose-specific phosphotransferase system IIA component (Ntr-type)
MLSEYLTPGLIDLQVEVENWEAAVRAGGELLVKADICEPRYIDAMVEAVKSMGPYMVLAPGIALAHARPEDGILKVGMSIINLAMPVEFGSPANDPVYLIISFGGVDKEQHIGMLRELATFLMDEEHQEILKTASSVDEVLKALAVNESK